MDIGKKYDVVVVGGGIAGVAASVAAARNGSKVCLIEKTGTLGGLATSGLIAYYLPICDGYGNQVASGIAEELLYLSIKLGPGNVPKCWDKKHKLKPSQKLERYQVLFNPASFAISLDNWVINNSVDIRFESLVVGAIVSARAGVPIKEETNSLAAWYYLVNKHSGTVDLRILGGFHGADRESLINRKFSGIKPTDITDFYILSRRMIADDVKREQKKKGHKKIFPITIPSIAQFRTTQNIIGLYQLDEKDSQKHFEDTIGMIGDWRKRGPVYEIPYRCLITNKINNLLVAGRCVSATKSGLEILRSIPACAVTGQAVGVTASLLVKNKISTQKININKLQELLRHQKVILPKGGIENENT